MRFTFQVAVLAVSLFLQSCGGGGGGLPPEATVENSSGQAPVTTEDTLFGLYTPSSTDNILLFDTVSDPRIMRWLTADNFLGTLHGVKTVDGDIESATKIVVENQNSEFIEIDISISDEITLRTLDANYILKLDSNGDLLYRIQVDEQYVEYLISDDDTSSAQLLDSYSQQNSFSHYERNTLRTGVPSIEITLNECSTEASDVSGVYVRANDRSGDYLGSFDSYRSGENSYIADVFGLSRTEAALADFSQNVINFLENYNYFDSFIASRDVTLSEGAERAEMLLEKRISQARDKLDELQDLSAFTSSDIVPTVTTGIKRSALIGLNTILKFAGKASSIFAAHEQVKQLDAIIDSTFEFATAVQHDQVAFEARVSRLISPNVTSKRTDLQSPDSPYPFISVDVPCRNAPESLVPEVSEDVSSEGVDQISSNLITWIGVSTTYSVEQIPLGPLEVSPCENILGDYLIRRLEGKCKRTTHGGCQLCRILGPIDPETGKCPRVANLMRFEMSSILEVIQLPSGTPPPENEVALFGGFYTDTTACDKPGLEGRVEYPATPLGTLRYFEVIGE